MPFDIARLHAFAPAQYQCEKCRALLTTCLVPDFPECESLTCPICRVMYLPTKVFPIYAWEKYVDSYGGSCLKTKDALTQAQRLGEIA